MNPHETEVEEFERREEVKVKKSQVSLEYSRDRNKAGRYHPHLGEGADPPVLSSLLPTLNRRYPIRESLVLPLHVSIDVSSCLYAW